jgi:hypothetical protein
MTTSLASSESRLPLEMVVSVRTTNRVFAGDAAKFMATTRAAS